MILEASTGRKVLLMVSCMCIQAISSGVAVSMSVMYAELVSVFHAKRTGTVLIQGMYSGITGGSGIFVIPLIKKYGPGPSTAVGALLGCIGLSLSYFSSSIWIVIVLTGVVTGIGMSFAILSSFISVSWVFHKHTSAALVFLSIGLGFGNFTFSYPAEILIQAYQWNGACLILGAIVLHCVPAAAFIYTCKDFYNTGSLLEKSECGIEKSKFNTIFVFQNVAIGLTLLNSFLMALTANVEQWFFVDIMITRGFERKQGAFLLTVIGFSKLTGRFIGAGIKLKSNSPTIQYWVFLWPILATSHILTIQIRNIHTLYGAVALYGIAYGITHSFASAILFEIAGLERYPQTVTCYCIVSGVGKVISTLVGGVIKDVYGEYDPMFYLSAAVGFYISISSLWLTYSIKKRNKKLLNDEYEPIISK